MAIKKYLLFMTPLDTKRKTFVASFDSREGAVEAAKRLRGVTDMEWQVIDSATTVCVEHNREGPSAHP
jgi:hypothetical protein